MATKPLSSYFTLAAGLDGEVAESPLLFALLFTVFFLFISAPSFGLPLTIKPACDNQGALFSPTPAIRFSKSAQFLKLPPLLRSSTMRLAFPGPISLDIGQSGEIPLVHIGLSQLQTRRRRQCTKYQQ